jgi:hypothetical protein
MMYTIVSCRDTSSFYLLIPNQSFIRLLLSIAVLNVPYTAGIEAALSLVYCITYVSKAQMRTFVDDAFPNHVTNSVIREIAPHCLPQE